MEQSHYICEDIEYANNELFPKLVAMFTANKLKAYNEKTTEEAVVYYDSYGLKLLKHGGHCRLVVSRDNENNTKNILIELRHAKKRTTQRFTTDSLDFTTEEMAKVFNFNSELIPIVVEDSNIHHIFMEYTTPDSWFGNLKPKFDFVTQTIESENVKTNIKGKAVIFSLVDRTQQMYNKHVASTFLGDVRHCFDCFDKLMKGENIKKVSSHRYKELFDLSNTGEPTSESESESE